MGRLQKTQTGKLTTRANKRLSLKNILPIEYFSNKANIPVVQQILNICRQESLSLESSIFSLGINLLANKKILNHKHVKKILSEFHYSLSESLIQYKIPFDEIDLLGLIYQCLLAEGKKNCAGSYYTPQQIAVNMTRDWNFSDGQTFFDPCCGSGAFFCALKNVSPQQIYGVDSDAIAVMIAKINLLLKFSDVSFFPQIYCLDYLKRNRFLFEEVDALSQKFNYIATNPPWGAALKGVQLPEIQSGESFSAFFVYAFRQLKNDGVVRFLFPESILNVKTHSDIRTFMLEQGRINSITLYDGSFTGVTTRFVDVEVQHSPPKKNIVFYSKNSERPIDINSFHLTKHKAFSLMSNDDYLIVRYILEQKKYDLRNSRWALGVVTGDNKTTLKDEPFEGCEPIYTGKEIQPYTLKSARKFLLFHRERFQQVAKDEYYRAKEKLAYKFISNKLVFAYDNTRSLFLNSANILIPNIPGMSIKTALAFLNSELFRYLYTQLFGEIKILKGNLLELPFPEISFEDDVEIVKLIDEILIGNRCLEENLQQKIFRLFNLSNSQIHSIKEMLNGTSY